MYTKWKIMGNGSYNKISKPQILHARYCDLDISASHTMDELGDSSLPSTFIPKL